MFNDLDNDSEDDSFKNQAKKKRLEEYRCEVVHSSLVYNTIKVPPMVEYKSIDDYYCKRKGEKFLSSYDLPISSLKIIKSPVVLRSPQPPQRDNPLPSIECHPFCFFSVEELTIVRELDNWANRKVCAVGRLDYACGINECYLNSTGENGSWKILLNVAHLNKNPTPLQLVQVYGILNVVEEKPKINVCFFRNLGTTYLPLFVESYKLMEKYVPKSIMYRKVLNEVLEER